jgi:hypothetical protein
MLGAAAKLVPPSLRPCIPAGMLRDSKRRREVSKWSRQHKQERHLPQWSEVGNETKARRSRIGKKWGIALQGEITKDLGEEGKKRHQSRTWMIPTEISSRRGMKKQRREKRQKRKIRSCVCTVNSLTHAIYEYIRIVLGVNLYWTSEFYRYSKRQLLNYVTNHCHILREPSEQYIYSASGKTTVFLTLSVPN